MTKYQFKTTPYKHQRAALRQMLRQQYGGALLMEPRTGKTKVAVDWLSVLNQLGRLKRAVIICPNRVMAVWVREILIHSPRRVHISVWDKKFRSTIGNRLSPDPPGYDLYLVIVNYDAFAVPGRRTKSGRRSKASGRMKLRRDIMRWTQREPCAMILDESHKIKSPSGKASNLIVIMSEKFKYRLILTGTPLTKAKRTHDVYMQWRFLNPARFGDLDNVKEFKERYGVWISKNGYEQFLRPRNLNELHARMARDSYVIRRDQCFDLPPREDIVEFVDLSSSADTYRQMAEEMVAQLEDGSFAEAPIAIVQALRLSQITSGFVTDDQGETKRIGYEKFDKLTEILEDLIEKEAKVVVAARWRADLDLLEEYCRERKIDYYAVRGKVKRDESDKAIADFEQASGPAVMAVQPAAAALGIDLSTAAHMVWYSHTPSWVDFTQCCDRIALSRNSTTFYHLVARETIDEVVLATLAGDGDIARAIMTRPGELLNGHPLDLDDQSRLQGIGSFQYATATSRRRRAR